MPCASTLLRSEQGEEGVGCVLGCQAAPAPWRCLSRRPSDPCPTGGCADPHSHKSAAPVRFSPPNNGATVTKTLPVSLHTCVGDSAQKPKTWELCQMCHSMLELPNHHLPHVLLQLPICCSSGCCTALSSSSLCSSQPLGRRGCLRCVCLVTQASVFSA